MAEMKDDPSSFDPGKAELGTQQGVAAIGDRTAEPLMQFFAYSHLPPSLQTISVEFYNLACKMLIDLPRNAERTVALRKLLEAKDCAVRSRLFVAPRIGG